MSKRRQAFQLLSQLIEVSEASDKEKVENDLSLPKGEGFYTFHLKKLRELLEDVGDS